jgi:uncharacterized SAM-binding protein YcdF (DUF218 family)
VDTTLKTSSQTAAAWVKAVFVPGSMAFLLSGVVVGAALLHGGPLAARIGRGVLTALAGGYVLLATPAVSSALVRGLHAGFGSIERPADAGGAPVVVVLGNGAVSHVAGGRALHQLVRRSAYCVLEGARLYELLRPEWIVASGGVADTRGQTRPESEIMRDELAKLGVPSDRVLLESESRSTAEQVAAVARLLREHALGDRTVLVTTPAHARRAMYLAGRVGLVAIPSIASELRYDDGEAGWRRWRPTLAALSGSHSAMYEYLALFYSRLKG